MRAKRNQPNLGVYPFCITLRCDLTCAFCQHCRGPGGPDLPPGGDNRRVDASGPFRIVLGGGDPFRYGDLPGWMRWARSHPQAVVEIEGVCDGLAEPALLARLVAAAPDRVRAVLPGLDDAELLALTGKPGLGQRIIAGISAARAAGLEVECVVQVNALTAPSLGATLLGLCTRFPELSIVLRRDPLRQSQGMRAPLVDDPRFWGELPSLGAALSSLPAELPGGAQLRVDERSGWAACLLPPPAFRAGLLPVDVGRRSLESYPAPDLCGTCAWQPNCGFRVDEGPAPRPHMRPLDREAALSLQGFSDDNRVAHAPGARSIRWDRSELSMPDLTCFAPFTSLVMCDIQNPAVPCAESWVDTAMTPQQESAILGIPVEEVTRLDQLSMAKWKTPWFRPSNEDWPIKGIWNAPLLQHMRRQMLERRQGGAGASGPSDRCRGNCRVILGVEEPFVDTLTRPDGDLTPEVAANRARLMDEIRGGAHKLSSLPLELVLGVASHCNISCGFCVGPEGAYGELTEQRVQEVKELLPTLMNLNVVGPGEPLMSVRFPRLLEHIADRGYPALTVSLTTNGTLLSRSWLKRHENVNFGQVRISLNAGSAKTHERMTGKKFFDRLMDNIDALAELRDKRGGRFQLTLSCVLSEFVLDDLHNFAEIVDRNRANMVVEPMYGDRDNLSPYTKEPRLRVLYEECRSVADDFQLRNPAISRAFRAMERFAGERLQKRHLTLLPHH